MSEYREGRTTLEYKVSKIGKSSKKAFTKDACEILCTSSITQPVESPPSYAPLARYASLSSSVDETFPPAAGCC